MFLNPTASIDDEAVKAALRDPKGKPTEAEREFATAIADGLPSRMKPAAFVLRAQLVLADARAGLGPASLVGLTDAVYAQLARSVRDLADRVLPTDAAAVVLELIEPPSA